MAIQTLRCRRGNHVWRRESQRGKPPANCIDLDCAADSAVIQAESNEPEAVNDEPIVSGMTGTEVADRLIFMLSSRGQLLSQQKERTYSGPRY